MIPFHQKSKCGKYRIRTCKAFIPDRLAIYSNTNYGNFPKLIIFGFTQGIIWPSRKNVIPPGFEPGLFRLKVWCVSSYTIGPKIVVEWWRTHSFNPAITETTLKHAQINLIVLTIHCNKLLKSYLKTLKRQGYRIIQNFLLLNKFSKIYSKLCGGSPTGRRRLT